MGGYHNSEQFMARKPEKIVTNNGMEIPSGRLQKTQRCPAIGMEQDSWSLQKKRVYKLMTATKICENRLPTLMRSPHFPHFP